MIEWGVLEMLDIVATDPLFALSSSLIPGTRMAHSHFHHSSGNDMLRMWRLLLLASDSSPFFRLVLKTWGAVRG